MSTEATLDEAQLLKRHDAMIRDIALMYAGTTVMDMDDLMQLGRIGFIEGIRAYDVDRGAKLTTYCWFHTRKAIVHEVRKMMDVGVSSREYEDIVRVRDAYHVLYSEYGREPTPSEIASVIGMDVSRVMYIQRNLYEAGDVLSLDEPLDIDDDLIDLHDVVPDQNTNIEEDYMQSEWVVSLLEAINDLEDEQREVIRLRYFEEYTWEEIEKAMGISRRTAKRRERDALTYLAEVG